MCVCVCVCVYVYMYIIMWSFSKLYLALIEGGTNKQGGASIFATNA